METNEHIKEKLVRNVHAELHQYLDSIKNKNEVRTIKKTIIQLNEDTGLTEPISEDNVEYMKIVRDALKVTSIPLDFEPVRAKYENLIIKEYCQLDK